MKHLEREEIIKKKKTLIISTLLTPTFSMTHMRKFPTIIGKNLHTTASMRLTPRFLTISEVMSSTVGATTVVEGPHS